VAKTLLYDPTGSRSQSINFRGSTNKAIYPVDINTLQCFWFAGKITAR